jgi:serine/threonine-protein kinase
VIAGDVIGERYEVEQLVGTGGMSSVYRAHDRVLERDVALKVLHERLNDQKDIVDRFGREAKLVAGLSHQNIVAVIDRGDHDGRPFIVLEFIPGENLKQLVGRNGPLHVERALELAIEIARGLSFAHQKGFVHRDVKPQNVLLNAKGEAKVTDFGIARPLEASDGETATGTVLGTCDYIAPEQAQGRRVDEHSDIYSLGIVVYELLTGEVPFAGDNFVAVAMQHINTSPPPVSLKRPDVPPRVETAVEKALAKDPEDRFPTMAAFCTELEACLAEVRSGDNTGATGILPAIKPDRTSKRRSGGKRRGARDGASHTGRRRWTVVLAVVGFAAVVVAVVLFAVTRDPGTGGGGGGGGGGSTPVSLTAVSSYDPDGDHAESPNIISYATDGLASTAWTTEHYNASGGIFTNADGVPKAGVGIILDAGAPVKLRSLKIVSTTPGYTAIVQSADTKFGPFSDDSSSQVGTATTTFALSGSTSQYYLIWLTNRGAGNQSVSIDEVTASK